MIAPKAGDTQPVVGSGAEWERGIRALPRAAAGLGREKEPAGVKSPPVGWKSASMPGRERLNRRGGKRIFPADRDGKRYLEIVITGAPTPVTFWTVI
jgi:hypothetical protein